MKTAEEILSNHDFDIYYYGDGKNEIIASMEEHTNQFKQPPTDEELDREAEKLYPAPQTDTGYELYTVWEATELERKAHIHARKMSNQQDKV